MAVSWSSWAEDYAVIYERVAFMTSLALFWAFCNRFPLNEERRLVECSQSAMNHPIVIRFIVGFWKET
jgi:hypothetical protein